MLVLEGGNLTVPKIIWYSPTDVTLCLEDGDTQTFRNYATLFACDKSITVHHRLDEDCGSAPHLN